MKILRHSQLRNYTPVSLEQFCDKTSLMLHTYELPIEKGTKWSSEFRSMDDKLLLVEKLAEWRPLDPTYGDTELEAVRNLLAALDNKMLAVKLDGSNYRLLGSFRFKGLDNLNSPDY